MKTTAVAVALAAALATPCVSHAAVFDLTFVGTTFTLDATLDASSLGGGEWLVTDMTGTVWTNGASPESTTLIPGGPGSFLTPSGSFIVDNVLYSPANPQAFDIDGLPFTAAGGEWNLWGNGSNYTLATCVGGCYTFDYGSDAVSPIPELATWAMLAVGFAALGFAGRRKTRPVSVA